MLRFGEHEARETRVAPGRGKERRPACERTGACDNGAADATGFRKVGDDRRELVAAARGVDDIDPLHERLEREPFLLVADTQPADHALALGGGGTDARGPSVTEIHSTILTLAAPAVHTRSVDGPAPKG